MTKISKTIAIGLALTGFAATSIAFAQDNADTKQPVQSKDMQSMIDQSMPKSDEQKG